MSGLVDVVRHLVAEGDDADSVLREVVATLAAEPPVHWAGIAFRDEGELVLGPEAGAADKSRRTVLPILYRGDPVGELWIDGELDSAEAEAVAEHIAPLVLIGWDTAGQAWEP